MRRCLARALVAALVAVPLTMVALPAQASGCPLLSDATHDVTFLGAVPSDTGQLDIVSADVASGASTVVAVLRVRTLEYEYGMAGETWWLSWTIDDTRYIAYARSTFQGQYLWGFSADGVETTSLVSLTVDRANASLIWTVPRAALPDLATPGRTFTVPSAQTQFFSSTADVVDDSAATYVDQSAGCISAS
jgi:hypothetical protein